MSDIRVRLAQQALREEIDATGYGSWVKDAILFAAAKKIVQRLDDYAAAQADDEGAKKA